MPEHGSVLHTLGSPTDRPVAKPSELNVGIVGASGFTGAELMRLLAHHPTMVVAAIAANSQAGTLVADLYPSLAAAYGRLEYASYHSSLFDGCDIVFAGLPHKASQRVVSELVESIDHVVDLSADFRLKDPAIYEKWYETKHMVPELIDHFAYGLPEVFPDELQTKHHVAVPGCYPTAATLALAPLVRAGVIKADGIIVDAASGVSGAGRPPKSNNTFCSVDEDFTAYGLDGHRHTPEIEQNLGTTVLFTPHLAPMSRGILATCYGQAVTPTTTAQLLDTMAAAYRDQPFVVVDERSPSTKATMGSNCAHLSARYDERTNTVVALAAIDNLVKGAAGQAVQCANIVSGLDQRLGLPLTGLNP